MEMLSCIFLMDSIYSSLAISITFFIFFLMLLKLGTKSTSKLPPGPRKLPIIGNIHQLISRGNLPHRTLRDLAKKYGPLMHLQLGEVSTIVVSSPEIAKEVLKTNDIKFATRPELLIAKVVGYDSSFISFSPYNEYLRQLRKLCAMELFSSKRIRSFQPIREVEVQKLIRWISSKSGSSVNLTEKLFESSYTLTSRVTFRNKLHKDMRRFETLVKKSANMLEGFALSDLYPSSKLLYVMSGMRVRLNKIFNESNKILDDILDEHIKRLATAETGEEKVDYEDLVDILLKYEGQGRLGFHMTRNNIKGVISDLFAGGSETSAGAINWAMSELMRNPRVMEKAQAEVRQVYNEKGCVDKNDVHQLHYLKLVIKETLRLHSAPFLLPRECMEKSEINGYDIPFKSRVIVNTWAIGRDPNHWTDAEKFYPERFLDDNSVDFRGTNFEFIPFGSGRRMCPGINLALAFIELFLSRLLYHFDWKLPDGVNPEDLDMIEASVLATRRKDDLFVIPIPYKPSIAFQ